MKPEARQMSPEEFLRAVGSGWATARAPGGAEALRERLALQAGPTLEGGPLGEWIDGDELPQDTRSVIRAGLVLRHLGAGSETWAEIRRTLRFAAATLARGWPGRGLLLPAEDPTLRPFQEVDAILSELEGAALAAEAAIEAGGYELRDGALVTPTGGNPRALLRDLVEVLLQAKGPRPRNSLELREWAAGELSALPFPPASLDPGSGKTLDNVLRNALRRK